MKKGTLVWWVGQTTGKPGHGITVSDEDSGTILVSVLSDKDTDEHRVIHCTVTWLKSLPPRDP